MAADKDAVRKPYERPVLIKTADLKKTVAGGGSPPIHSVVHSVVIHSVGG